MSYRFVLVLLACMCVWPQPASAAPPPIETYGELPGVETIRLSPAGTRMALIAVVGEKRELVVAEVRGKPLKALALGDAKIEDLDWAGEDILLVTRRSTQNLGVD